MRVKLEIIESTSQKSLLKKLFYLEDFLEQFSSRNHKKQMEDFPMKRENESIRQTKLYQNFKK